jgi:hypothetical protein
MLMYGAKAWTWTKAGIGRLLTAGMRFLRIVGGRSDERE